MVYILRGLMTYMIKKSTFTWAAYSKTVKVTLANVANTRQKWNIVKNTFMLKLSLNFYARFVGEVVVSKY
ncbi:unnamed protein product [Nippostrongylus brasiliensis]|uniref:Transposase n=1 Tax=Nippostrongylus brasiliensis TaxID=27835 RepID=A0A0N4XYH0_NIPBR|nr:hypothetical protein Q1695_013271 [Nippostrongylus brasiliensis]VDL71719.1 unnamed protein product [Nippostrongylus brasiliensis]